MNWDDLRIFLTLVRSKTLSEAGRRLKLDHATVGRRIKALEKSLGAQLFERGPTGYVITPNGTDLVGFAEKMETLAMGAQGRVGEVSETLSGVVRVAAPEGVASFSLVDVAHKLCQEHRQLKIELLTNAQKYSLAKREADFVVSLSRPERGRIKVQKIADISMHFYGHKDYLSSRPAIATQQDLLRHRGIAFVPDQIPEKELDYRMDVDADLDAHITATSVHVQQAAIIQGAGIGVMHDFMARMHPDLVKLLPSEVSIKRSLWGAIHLDQENIRRVSLVSQRMVEALRVALR